MPTRRVLVVEQVDQAALLGEVFLETRCQFSGLTGIERRHGRVGTASSRL